MLPGGPWPSTVGRAPAGPGAGCARQAGEMSCAPTVRMMRSNGAAWHIIKGLRDRTQDPGLRRGFESAPLAREIAEWLRRLFATTNCIENLIGTVRHLTRNVKRWRDGAMIRRWVSLALGRPATRFRRIKGHGELATLATALRTGPASEAAA